ncbi:hypothetical protein ACIGEZ_14620 [Streptomyces sp. NPDC085481]|uniref:hypothetical protein n=1 Tax=Streptomyces sp. NPDC085481 TaxID=3365727 RepID=UPI0037CFB64F
MATPEHAVQADRTDRRVSMSDLLASCAAATAVSTPPREPEQPAREEPVAGRDEAA